MKLLKMGSNKSENGEDATQKLKNVINNLVNSEDAGKKTPLQKAIEKSDIVECRSPKNVETIYTKFTVRYMTKIGFIQGPKPYKLKFVRVH